MRRWQRLYHTLRYLRPAQIGNRIWRNVHAPRPNLKPAPPRRALASPWTAPAPHPHSLLGPRRFCFLNRPLELTGPDAWHRLTEDRLWLYNLHYFDDLTARDAASRHTWHLQLIDEWLRENPPASGPGWEPYPTSLRIVNFVKWALAGNSLSDSALHSLAVQTRYLLGTLEFHLMGNHLLANAKALVFAGSFFLGPEADLWLDKGLAILTSQLSEQILPDGAHVELSPMYHSIILEDLLDLCNLSHTFAPRIPAATVERFRDTSQKMRSWLAAMCHPDGGIALFNDAAFGIATTPAALDAYACRLGREQIPPPRDGLTLLADSGYVRLQWDHAVAILDVGPIGPDYQPGHAHADTLSFELSLRGHRMIVDTGTFCYGESDQRRWDRSTAAHNTVVINGQNSSEVWSSHRVARRAYPQRLHASRSDGQLVVSCAHDGYKRLAGRPIHQRKWRCGTNFLEITDHISGQADTVCASLHFHPAVQLAKATENSFVAAIDHASAMLTVDGAKATLGWGKYHPEFGRELKCPRIGLQFTGGGATHRLSWR